VLLMVLLCLRRLLLMRSRSNYDYENRLWLFMPKDEERVFYSEVLSRVLANPRFYLDRLSDGSLSEFRVSFVNYRAKKRSLYK